MKKFALAVVVVATLMVALMSSNQVFAQGPAPANPQAPGGGARYGNGPVSNGGALVSRGDNAGRGNNAGRGAQVTAGDGILHDAMIAVYAEALGVPVDTLNARLAAGETLAQIAAEKGLTGEQFTALMDTARSQAIDEAVAAGTLTQAQADWLKQRGAGNSGAARGAGQGMRGAGAGLADCPYFPQTTP